MKADDEHFRILDSVPFLNKAVSVKKQGRNVCTLSVIIKLIWWLGPFHRQAAKINAHECVYTYTKKHTHKYEETTVFISPPTACSNWPSGNRYGPNPRDTTTHLCCRKHVWESAIHMQCKVRHLLSVCIYSATWHLQKHDIIVYLY